MNLSPCFNKRIPVIWRPLKENYTYIQATLEDKDYIALFDDSEFLLGSEKIVQLSKDQNPIIKI